MGPYSRECVVINKMGIHARPSTKIVQAANENGVKPGMVFIGHKEGGVKSDATSIMSIMTLAAPCGATLVVSTARKDCHKAVDAIADLIATMALD